MKQTANYNLKKPDNTDFYNIKDMNDNADIVDAELKKVNDELLNKATVTHSHAISDVTGLISTLDNKSNAGHTHTIDEIGELRTTLAAYARYFENIAPFVTVAEIPLEDFCDFGDAQCFGNVYKSGNQIKGTINLEGMINAEHSEDGFDYIVLGQISEEKYLPMFDTVHHAFVAEEGQGLFCSTLIITSSGEVVVYFSNGTPDTISTLMTTFSYFIHQDKGE